MSGPMAGVRVLEVAQWTFVPPEGHELLMEIARSSDVFLTNFLPDARKKLKIDVEDVRLVNPKIIYARGSAYGPLGDDGDKGGYDMTAFWCRAAGAASTTPSDLDGVVAQPGPAYGDSIGGMTIAGGIAAALFERERNGVARVVDISLLGVGVWAMGVAVNAALVSGKPWVWNPSRADGVPGKRFSGVPRNK